MANPLNANWPTRWPMMLPLPHAITRSRGMVPNRQSVDWPQSQFAPLYLPPGSPSFEPYSYLKNNTPLASARPTYTAFVPAALGPSSVNTYKGGPGGDIARLPLGGLMLSNPSRRSAMKTRNRLTNRVLATEAAGRQRQYRQRIATNQAIQRMAAAAGKQRTANWGWRKTAQAVEASSSMAAPSLFPAVVRMGARPTGIPIHAGIPQAATQAPPEPIATAGLTNLYGGLALSNTGDCGCGDSMTDKVRDWWDSQDSTMKLVYGAGAAFAAYKLFTR